MEATIEAPYSNDTTSREAAAAVTPKQAAADRLRVFNLLRTAPSGLTDEEMQEQLGMSGSTQRPRRGELVKAGAVANSGSTRATHSGRNAIVWVAA